MSFWSGEKLSEDLPHLISPFNEANINCASYELTLDSEAFVTQDRLMEEAQTLGLTQVMEDRPPFDKVVIPPGQFAFLLTHETVNVPANALALISMKAGLKFKGLINVSGFHVDPGFEGKLLFSVYNAGPQEIILTNRQRLFIIVYSDLDRVSRQLYSGPANSRGNIDADKIQNMSGQAFSPMLLQRRMKELESSHLILKMELANKKSRDNMYLAFGGTLLSVCVAIVIAVTLTDWAQFTVGRFVKSTLNHYEKTVADDQKTLAPASKSASELILKQTATKEASR